MHIIFSAAHLDLLVMDLNIKNSGVMSISDVNWGLGNLKPQLLFCKVSGNEILSKTIYKIIGINWKLQLEATDLTLYLKSLNWSGR